MKNIVLIGMPGSGKTSVGKILSQRLGLPLLDTDAMVSAQDGRTIPEIFAQEGESRFRDLESQAVERAAEFLGAVISTGGGLILRAANMEALSKNGMLFFLNRPPEILATLDHGGRPLLAGGEARIHQLYEQRIALYRGYADAIIENLGTAEEAAQAIITQINKEAAV